MIEQRDAEDEVVAGLVRIAQSGSMAAFDALVSRFRRSIFAICFGMLRNKEDADDATQSTFLRAFRHLDSVDPDRFGGWIASIARNRCREHLRGLKPESTLDDVDRIALQSSGTLANSTDAMFHQITLNELMATMERLPDHLREVISLFTIGGETAEEISRILDLPLPTVKWRIHEARKILRRRFTTTTC